MVAALRLCHALAGALHFANFLTILVWTSVDASRGYSPSIPTSIRVLRDLPSQNNYTSIPIATPLYPRAMSILFAFMSFLAHVVMVVPFGASWGVGWRAYARNVRRRMNPIRWIEYGASATTVLDQIGALCGLTDLAQIINQSGCNVAMISFGQTAEKSWRAETDLVNELRRQEMQLRGVSDWLARAKGTITFEDQTALNAFVNGSVEQAKRRRNAIETQPFWRRGWVQSYAFGCVAGIAPWISIFVYFYSALQQKRDAVPWFVYTIIIGEFFQFFGFAGVMLLQHMTLSQWRRLTCSRPRKNDDGRIMFGLFTVSPKTLTDPTTKEIGFDEFKWGKSIVVSDFYEVGEYFYNVLSATSKTWLTWFSFFAPI